MQDGEQKEVFKCGRWPPLEAFLTPFLWKKCISCAVAPALFVELDKVVSVGLDLCFWQETHAGHLG